MKIIKKKKINKKKIKNIFFMDLQEVNKKEMIFKINKIISYA